MALVKNTAAKDPVKMIIYKKGEVYNGKPEPPVALRQITVDPSFVGLEGPVQNDEEFRKLALALEPTMDFFHTLTV